MLDLHKLEIFLLVAEQGSMSKAADILYLSQAAISQHVKMLEGQLGTKLFVRHRGGVRLTPAGETLLTFAKKILWLAAEAESVVTDVQNLKECELKLGATPAAAVYLLPSWIRGVHEKYKHLRVKTFTDTTLPTVQAVLNRQLDLAIIEGEFEDTLGLGAKTLQDIDLYLVVNPSHPWQQRESVSVHELTDQPIVMRSMPSQTRIWIDHFFAQHEALPNIVAEFNDPEAIKQAVALGEGVAILPLCMLAETMASGRLSILSIEELTMKRSLKLIWNDRRPFPPMVRAFIQYLAQEYPEIDLLP